MNTKNEEQEKGRYTITSGRTNGALHAIVIAKHKEGDGAHANVFTDGSVRVKWWSGRVTDIIPPAEASGSPEIAVQKMVEVFTKTFDCTPVVHTPPQFATADAFGNWMKSIGLETTMSETDPAERA